MALPISRDTPHLQSVPNYRWESPRFQNLACFYILSISTSSPAYSKQKIVSASNTYDKNNSKSTHKPK